MSHWEGSARLMVDISGDLFEGVLCQKANDFFAFVFIGGSLVLLLRFILVLEFSEEFLNLAD
jgi:hypothetical protein